MLRQPREALEPALQANGENRVASLFLKIVNAV